MPDHSAGLVAVGFISFPELSPATESPLVTELCELELQENFKEDCCLLSFLGNVYMISF